MENKDKEWLQAVEGIFTDYAEDLSRGAMWYQSVGLSSSVKECRFCQKNLLDALELVRSDCETLDDVGEVLESLKVEVYKTAKFLQSEAFNDMAELAISLYLLFDDVAELVELNK